MRAIHYAILVVIAIVAVGAGVLGKDLTNLTLGATSTSSSTFELTFASSYIALQSESSLESGKATCVSLNELPDRTCTPGATNPAVNQSDISSTICVDGWTDTVRPNETYTENLKYASIRDYHYNDTYVSHYEEDHLIPLELGGSPTSVYNLWAEPHYGTWGSYVKDTLEDYLNAQVCEGKMPLVQAQQDIATNWISAYQQLISVNPTITTENGAGD
jgi:hypothetical protein